MHSPELSQASAQYREIELAPGRIRYRDHGSGAPIVLVHGLLVNGGIWDRLVELLSPHARCVVPELPLGSHRTALHDGADRSPHAIARLIAELIERLELDDVTLVGNDTGGALCQLVAGHDRGRLGALVLTNCDAFDHFPPPRLRPMVSALKLPGVAAGAGLLGRSPRVRGMFSKLKLTMHPIDDELVRSWVQPLGDRRIRSDLAGFVRGISATDMCAAAERLRGFDHPSLIAWGKSDPYFPFADAQRLAATLPRSRLQLIDDASTFVQLDAPQRLADLIFDQLAARAPARQEAR
jgi:pimeloyl-ACP methyl ester carboxylesterase